MLKRRDPFEEVSKEYERLQERNDLMVATIAGGCFWCMEGPFEAMEGVEEVITGYVGGTSPRPTYKEVVSGQTDYREGAQIFFDPNKISYGEILEQYWWQVDPTDAGGQFADRGRHYTTAIYYHDDAQEKEAERQIEELEGSERFSKEVVTETLPFSTFYPAEDYHQDFYQKQSAYYRRYKKGSGRQDYIEAMQQKYGQ